MCHQNLSKGRNNQPYRNPLEHIADDVFEPARPCSRNGLGTRSTVGPPRRSPRTMRAISRSASVATGATAAPRPCPWACGRPSQITGLICLGGAEQGVERRTGQGLHHAAQRPTQRPRSLGCLHAVAGTVRAESDRCRAEQGPHNAAAERPAQRAAQTRLPSPSWWGRCPR